MGSSTLSAIERAVRRTRWAEALARGTCEEIDAAFVAGGAMAPRVQWEPAVDALRTPPCRALLEYWHSVRAGADLPLVSAIEPQAMRKALGYVLLFEPVDGGEDFRYRVYGSLVATVSDVDLTGRRMSEHPASDYVVDFAIACGRAGLARRLPLFTLRHPAKSDRTHSWERIQLPLAGPSGAVERFLVGNVPVDRDGEVLRPAF